MDRLLYFAVFTLVFTTVKSSRIILFNVSQSPPTDVIPKQLKTLVILTTICTYTKQTTVADFQRFWYVDFANSLETCSQGHMVLDKNSSLIVEVHVPCVITTIKGQNINLLDMNNVNYKEYAVRLMEFALLLLVSQSVDVYKYKHHLLKLPNNSYNNLQWSGLGVQDCKTQECYSWYNSNDLNIGLFMHELGHNLGLGHASTLYDEYGDKTCAMGDAKSNSCFNSPHRHMLGWSQPLNQYYISTAKNNSNITITLSTQNSFSIINDAIYLERKNKGIAVYLKNTNSSTTLLSQLSKKGDTYQLYVAQQLIWFTSFTHQIKLELIQLSSERYDIQAVYHSYDTASAKNSASGNHSIMMFRWLFCVVFMGMWIANIK